MHGPIDLDIWFWRLGAGYYDRGWLERWHRVLSDDECARMARFKFEADQVRYLVCRAWMRRVLGWHLGRAPRLVRFDYGEREKPLSADNPDELTFNLSHTAGLAALAVARGPAVGVDVERLRPINYDFMAYTLTEAELASLAHLKGAARTRGFLRIWTAKEAFIKATGEGFFRSLSSFEVRALPECAAHAPPIEGGFQVVDPDLGYDEGDWRLFTFVPTPSFAGALVVRAGAEVPIRINSRWLCVAGS